MRPCCPRRSGAAALPIALMALAALCGAAAAAAPRDPMHATPARAAALDPAAPAAAPASAALPPLVARHLLVVDGRRYVVEGASRRAVGDQLGGARIESIEDSAVVVRRGGLLQRLPLFAGVVKQPSGEPPPGAAARGASAASRHAAAVPPSGLQGQLP